MMCPSLSSCFRRHCCNFSISPPERMNGHLVKESLQLGVAPATRSRLRATPYSANARALQVEWPGVVRGAFERKALKAVTALEGNLEAQQEGERVLQRRVGVRMHDVLQVRLQRDR